MDSPITPGTDSSSQGKIFTMGRLPKTQEEKRRGLIFMETQEAGRRPVLFARKQGHSIANSKNEEVVFERGGPGGDPAGYINFHHWLLDRDKSIIVASSNGQQTNLKRSRLLLKHAFELNGRKLFWRRSGGGEGSGFSKKITRPHLECVDENDEVVALFTQKKMKCFGSSGEEEKLGGELEIKEDGLDASYIEFLLMTFTAVYVKLQKRLMQASQAGWAGGLPTAVGYIIAG